MIFIIYFKLKLCQNIYNIFAWVDLEGLLNTSCI